MQASLISFASACLRLLSEPLRFAKSLCAPNGVMNIDTSISHLEWTDITGILLNEMDCASEASFSCRIDAIRLVAKVEDQTTRDVTVSDDNGVECCR